MKAEHRHELKTNELAEWIVNFPQWAKENLKMIIYISIVIIAVAGAYLWRAYQKNVVEVQKKLQLTSLIKNLSNSQMQILRAQAEGIDYSYILIQVANSLGDFAKNTKNENMAALALIKKAHALRAELHYRMGTTDRQNMIDQIDQAKAAYNEAIAKSVSNSSLRALATFGIGLCEEELGNFDGAKQIYKQITEDPSFEVTTAATSAKRRLKIMDDYRQAVAFKEPIKPLPDETIQPEFNFEQPDINFATLAPAVESPNLSASE